MVSAYIDCGQYAPIRDWMCRVEAPEDQIEAAKRTLAQFLVSGEKDGELLKKVLEPFEARAYFGSPLYYFDVLPSRVIHIMDLI